MIRREDVDGAVRAVSEQVIELAEAIRADPELSGAEHRAAGRCARALSAHGFEVAGGAAGLATAFVARRSIGTPGSRIAFLAEYDALPGLGHGCGHHLIAATAVGAAAAMARLAAEADGVEIQVVGTPSEETIGGKIVLAEAGLFDGLDGVLMFHPGHEWRTVTDSLACQSVEVVFGGRSAHAVAAPEDGANALEALIDLFTAAREIKRAFSNRVHLPGVILEGGVRANIVPDRAVARFSLRARTGEEREDLVDALLGRIGEIARAHRCRHLVRPVDNPYDEMRTNLALARVLRGELEARGAIPNDAPRGRKGSIDAGNVSRRAPAVHAYLPAAPPEAPLHSRMFAQAATAAACREAILTAIAAMAATGLRLARDRQVRERVMAEFRSQPPAPSNRRWPLLTSEPIERVEC